MKLKYLIIWLAALAAIACGLLLYESHFLWKVQELNLFLQTSLFFKEQMVAPAGMLTYFGTWFTQFFHHPWMGVVMLCAWWLLLMWLLKQTFHVAARWASLMLIPVALLLLTNVDMGYWVYILKLRGHFFLTTIATTAVVALLWIFRSLPDKFWLRAVWMVLTGVVGYPLMGIYGLAATLLMGIWSWRLMSRWRAAVYTVIAILVAVAVPLLCYRYVYHETNFANIYYAGLPLFYITERYANYYIPYYLLALFMLVMVCLPLTTKKETAKVKGEKDKATATKQKQKGKAWLSLAAEVAALAVIAYGVVHFWYKDENFHHEVKMQHLIDQTDWEGVMQEATTQVDEPTRAIVMMRNLALSRLGRQGELMYQYRNGAKASLLNGEKKIARKYINILKNTLYFDEWATNAEKLLDNPQLIAKDKEMEPITHMLHYADILSSERGNVERFIMRQLAMSTYADDPIFQEQTLLASLWVKDPNIFWRHFTTYVSKHPEGPIPIAYQEAAYLFAMMENLPNIDQMPLSQGVKESFNKFIETYSQYEGMKAEDVRQQAGSLYDNTFFYDYHMMSNLPEY